MLHELICDSEHFAFSTSREHVRLQDLDAVGKTSLVANSLKAYLTTLNEPELKRVASKVNSDCQLWLSRLFRYSQLLLCNAVGLFLSILVSVSCCRSVPLRTGVSQLLLCSAVGPFLFMLVSAASPVSHSCSLIVTKL